MNAQTRDLRASQEQRAQTQFDQQQALQPFQQQVAQQNFALGEQQLAAGKQKLDRADEDRIIRSVVEFSPQILPSLQAGDIDKSLQILEKRFATLQANGDPTNETLDAINSIRNGDTQTVIDNIGAYQQAARDRGLLGGAQISVGQREHENLVSLIEADPELKTIDAQEAARKLGRISRAVGSSSQTVAKDKELTQQVADSKAKIRQAEKFGELTASSRAKAIDKGFEQIGKIDLGLSNIDAAIEAVNNGANTGFLAKKFPSIKAASVMLDNIQGRMALDVIGAVTFGALSQGELDLAREVALPTGLKGPALVGHLQKRKAAQQKLRDYYGEQIQFLDQGGTVAGFLRSKKRESSSATPTQNTQGQAGIPVATPSTSAPSAQKGAGVIMTDANGNRARVFADGTFEEL